MSEKPCNKVPKDSIGLQFAGELVMPKLLDSNMQNQFRRYEFLFETLANLPREERLLSYQLINALALTSHARKTVDKVLKRELFALKNAMLINILNKPQFRRKVVTRYLKSKNFLVKNYCPQCVTANTEQNMEKHKWKFCAKCEVDKNFYDVLSLQQSFAKGHVTLFLGRELLEQIKGLNLAVKGKLGDTKEEARLEKYHFNAKNLDALDLESLKAMQKRLLGL